MLAVLSNRTYRRLLAAQVIALTGTGLATVALGLLASDLAGADAGAVLPTVLAITMIAYIGIAAFAAAWRPTFRARPSSWEPHPDGPSAKNATTRRRCAGVEPVAARV